MNVGDFWAQKGHFSTSVGKVDVMVPRDPVFGHIGVP